MENFNEFLKSKQNVVNECHGYSVSDSIDINIKAKIYEKFSKLAESDAVKSLIKDLFKLSKDEHCDTYQINQCLEHITMRQLINLYEYENPYSTPVTATYQAKALKKLK